MSEFSLSPAERCIVMHDDAAYDEGYDSDGMPGVAPVGLDRLSKSTSSTVTFINLAIPSSNMWHKRLVI